MMTKNKLSIVFGMALVSALAMSASISPKAMAQRGRFEERRVDDHVREQEALRAQEEERRRWAMEHPIHHEIYAPAQVVYAPPPPPSPGLTLVLPINFH